MSVGWLHFHRLPQKLQLELKPSWRSSNLWICHLLPCSLCSSNQPDSSKMHPCCSPSPTAGLQLLEEQQHGSSPHPGSGIAPPVALDPGTHRQLPALSLWQQDCEPCRGGTVKYCSRLTHFSSWMAACGVPTHFFHLWFPGFLRKGEAVGGSDRHPRSREPVVGRCGLQEALTPWKRADVGTWAAALGTARNHQCYGAEGLLLPWLNFAPLALLRKHSAVPLGTRYSL